jgi:hypothetical protein
MRISQGLKSSEGEEIGGVFLGLSQVRRKLLGSRYRLIGGGGVAV